MINVDIVSPVGGAEGGIENVIIAWTKHLDPEKFNLRVFHCHQGIRYLFGFPGAYCVDIPFERADYDHLVSAYTTFIDQYGAPDICIATNWPMMVKACCDVRQRLDLHDMKVFSWIHNRIEEYEKEGLGGVPDMVGADAHLSLNHRMTADIRAVDPDAKIHEVYNPVKLQQISDTEVDPLMLTYVGRLSYIKRIDIILEAMYRSHYPWKLRLIGDGEIRGDISGWIDMLKLTDRVKICGWSTDPWSLCRDSGILVMASEFEGFGLVAFEASSAGMTVISTPVDGVSDYIMDGKNGYLYPYENAELLAYILDGIADGTVNRCDPKDCRDSMMKYSTEEYFKRIESVLEDSLGMAREEP